MIEESGNGRIQSAEFSRQEINFEVFPWMNVLADALFMLNQLLNAYPEEGKLPKPDQERLLSLLERALFLDPLNRAILTTRAQLFAGVFQNPERAIFDLNILLALPFFPASEQVVKKDENGHIYPYLFQVCSEGELYYIRSLMHSALGNNQERLSDLSTAALLGWPAAIREWQGREERMRRPPLPRYIRV